MKNIKLIISSILLIIVIIFLTFFIIEKNSQYLKISGIIQSTNISKDYQSLIIMDSKNKLWNIEISNITTFRKMIDLNPDVLIRVEGKKYDKNKIQAKIVY